MPARTQTNYRFEADEVGGGTYRDLSQNVEEFDVSYGTDAESASSDVRFRTARGQVRLLNDGSVNPSGALSVRLVDPRTDRIAWEGRAVPSEHEELLSPDFIYWALEGRFAFDLRKVNDYFIAPQSNVGELDETTFLAPSDWGQAESSTSYIVGEMTPAQLFNRLAPVCGGFAHEANDGVVEFTNLRQAFDADPQSALTADLEPESRSISYLNRQTVRSESVVRATNYVPDPAERTVGITELRYGPNPVSPLLSYKPSADRTLRIDEWVVPTSPADVNVALQGGGGRFGRIRAPVLGVAGIAELFYVPFIPAAGNRLDTNFAILFHAKVSRLQPHDLRKAKFTESAETFGSIDANLAPWATAKAYQRVIRPYLEIRSQPLRFTTVEYSEAQNGAANLDAVQNVQPGQTVLIELPKPDGTTAVYKTLVLAVRISYGRDRIPMRRISGVSTVVRATIKAFDLEASAFGPFDGRVEVSIDDPDADAMTYCRYRKVGDTSWTALTALAQADEVVFALDGLDASTTYEVEGGLESDYSDALTDAFTTDASPEDLLACTFDLVDGEGDALTGTLRGFTFLQKFGTFLALVDETVYAYNASGRFVRATALPASTTTAGPPARFPNITSSEGRSIDSTLRGASRTGISNGLAWLDRTENIPQKGFLALFNPVNSDDVPILSVWYQYGPSSDDYFVQCRFTYNPNTSEIEWLDFRPALWSRNELTTELPRDSDDLFVGGYVTADDGDRETVASIGHDGSDEVEWRGDGDSATWDMDPLDSIRGVAVTQDVNRFYVADDDTKRIWAYDRDQTECVTQAITPLLSAITVNSRRIRGFSPRRTTYRGFATPTDTMGRSVVLSQFPNFETWAGPYRVSGIPLLPRYEVIVEYPSQFTVTAGLVPQPDFKSAHTWKVKVVDPVSEASTTYTVNVYQDIDRSEPVVPLPPEPPPKELVTGSLAVSPTSIVSGQGAAILRWTSEGDRAMATVDKISANTNTASVVEADLGKGAASGFVSVMPTAEGNHYYRLRVQRTGESDFYARATLTVTAAPTGTGIRVIDFPPVKLEDGTTVKDPVPEGTKIVFPRLELEIGETVTLDDKSFTNGGTAEVPKGIGDWTPIMKVLRGSTVVAAARYRISRRARVKTIAEEPDVPPEEKPVETEVTRDPAKVGLLVNGGIQGLTVQTGTSVRFTVTFSGSVNYVRLSITTGGKTLYISLPSPSTITRTIQRTSTIKVIGYNAERKAVTQSSSITVVTTAAPIDDPEDEKEPPKPVPQPTGGISIAGNPSLVLEGSSVNVAYATLNAVSATLSTSRGLITLGQRGLPLSKGFVLDTPASAIRYTLTMVGADGSIVKVRTKRLQVLALPDAPKVDAPEVPPYSGQVRLSITSAADSISVTDLADGALVIAGRNVTGSKATVLVNMLRDNKALAARTFQVRQLTLQGFALPNLVDLATDQMVEWPVGRVKNASQLANATVAGERFIAPTRPNTGLYGDLVYSSGSRPVPSDLVNDRTVAYRARPNPLRTRMLGTGSVTTLTNDPFVRRAISNSFFRGGSFSSIVRASRALSFGSITAACWASCNLQYASALNAIIARQVNALSNLTLQYGIRILESGGSYVAGNRLVSLSNLIKDVSVVSQTALTTIFRFVSGVGTVLLLNDLFQIGGQTLTMTPDAMVTTLLLIDNVFKFGGLTEFQVERVPRTTPPTYTTELWTSPRVEYDQSKVYNHPIRVPVPVTVHMGNTSFRGNIITKNQKFVELDNEGNPKPNPITVPLPEMNFPADIGARLDLFIGGAGKLIEETFSGIRLAALAEGEILSLI